MHKYIIFQIRGPISKWYLEVQGQQIVQGIQRVPRVQSIQRAPTDFLNVDFIVESGFLGYKFYARMCCKTHQKSPEILYKYENYEKSKNF